MRIGEVKQFAARIKFGSAEFAARGSLRQKESVCPVFKRKNCHGVGSLKAFSPRRLTSSDHGLPLMTVMSAGRPGP